MKDKRGFTLIELLAVIVVLAIVMVLAVTTVLPMMGQSREKAFRIEATNAVKYAGDAYDLFNLGEIDINKDSTKSCYNSTTNKMCFTIDELIDLQLYQVDKGIFLGKVDIDLTNRNQPIYTLYFKKNDEFRIVGEQFNTYVDYGELNNAAWDNKYNSCTCS